MQREKKQQSKRKRKTYSDEELSALGIFKDKNKATEEEQQNNSSAD
ncbi:MAG: hypothetical protein QCI00_05330 [Candidatus Thermoplasmatota archaeon]|nr:hypothetical protein [Candidatus Thermoplasmatota archaeon]